MPFFTSITFIYPVQSNKSSYSNCVSVLYVCPCNASPSKINFKHNDVCVKAFSAQPGQLIKELLSLQVNIRQQLWAPTRDELWVHHCVLLGKWGWPVFSVSLARVKFFLSGITELHTNTGSLSGFALSGVNKHLYRRAVQTYTESAQK